MNIIGAFRTLCHPSSSSSTTLSRLFHVNSVVRLASLPVCQMHKKSERIAPCREVNHLMTAKQSLHYLSGGVASIINKPHIRMMPSSARSFSSMPNNRTSIGVLGTLASVGVLLAGKSQYVIGVLKLGKAWTLVSMVGSSLAYSLVFGWPYAVGMVAMIAVHESGHAWEMHRQGIESSPMVFIPFVGAAVAMKGMPINVYNDAKIALAGPAAGSAAAVLTSIYGVYFDSQFAVALADFGLMINLFNLLPIGILDGGKVANAISKYVLLGGLGVGAVLAFTGQLTSPLFYLILVLGGLSTFNRFWNDDLPPSFYAMSQADKGWILMLYVGLIAGLLAAHSWNRKHLYTRSREF